jgi:hypothetical protein
MTTEWLALWIHFLWSGTFTMLFGVFAWWKMGVMMRPMANQAESGGVKEATKQRRRLLRVAAMVSLSLL